MAPENRRTQTHNLRILNAIAEALNRAPDVEEALRRTLALVAELLGLERSNLYRKMKALGIAPQS